MMSAGVPGAVVSLKGSKEVLAITESFASEGWSAPEFSPDADILPPPCSFPRQEPGA